MTAYSMFACLLVVNLTVGLFGSYAGYTVSGVPHGQAVAGETPGILGIANWAFESVRFMWSMITFQVDDMPAFLSAIFIFMSLMMVFLIVRLVRGNN